VTELRSECEDLQNQLDCADRQALGCDQVLVAMERHNQAGRREAQVLNSETQRRRQTADSAEQLRSQLQARLDARNQELTQLQTPLASRPPMRTKAELASLKAGLKVTRQKQVTRFTRTSAVFVTEIVYRRLARRAVGKKRKRSPPWLCGWTGAAWSCCVRRCRAACPSRWTPRRWSRW